MARAYTDRRPFRIVVPVDGSEAAGHSLDWSIAFARRTEAALSVCSVFDPVLTCVSAAGGAMIDPQPMLETLEADAGAFCAAAVAHSHAGGIAATSMVLEGSPAAAICEFARDRDADMIVLGTHGRTGLALGVLGSVTNDIVRATDIAVVSVRPQAAAAEPGPVVIAVDGSTASVAAATFALRVARALHVPIHLVHVVAAAEPAPFGALDVLADEAAAAGVARTMEIRRGDVIGSVLAAAAERGAALIATGTHARGVVGRFFLGSVAAGLMRGSAVPVLVVRRAGR